MKQMSQLDGRFVGRASSVGTVVIVRVVLVVGAIQYQFVRYGVERMQSLKIEERREDGIHFDEIFHGWQLAAQTERRTASSQYRPVLIYRYHGIDSEIVVEQSGLWQKFPSIVRLAKKRLGAATNPSSLATA